MTLRRPLLALVVTLTVTSAGCATPESSTPESSTPESSTPELSTTTSSTTSRPSDSSIPGLPASWVETSDFPEWSHFGSRTGPSSPAPVAGAPLADGAYILNEVFFDVSGELSSIQVQPFPDDERTVDVESNDSRPVIIPFTSSENTRVVVRTHYCYGKLSETAWLGDWGTFLSTMRWVGTDISDWTFHVTSSYDMAPGDFVDYTAVSVATATILPSDCLRSFVWSATNDGSAQPWFVVFWLAGQDDTIDDLWRRSVYPAAISVEAGVATFYFDARILNFGG